MPSTLQSHHWSQIHTGHHRYLKAPITVISSSRRWITEELLCSFPPAGSFAEQLIRNQPNVLLKGGQKPAVTKHTGERWCWMCVRPNCSTWASHGLFCQK